MCVCVCVRAVNSYLYKYGCWINIFINAFWTSLDQHLTQFAFIIGFGVEEVLKKVLIMHAVHLTLVIYVLAHDIGNITDNYTLRQK